jgi:hypothetical protein
MRIVLLWLFIILLVPACASRVSLPGGLAGVDESNAKAAWARVLRQHVDARGQIDFAAITAQPMDLETWIAYVARVSPRSHPQRFSTPAAVMAYYIDAYNGLAMYGVIRSGVLPEQKLRFFLLRQYVIGGGEMSLYALENDLIRPLGEPRVHFALNCMSKSCPRLPRVPWDSTRLNAQLNAAATEFLNTPEHIRVDHEARSVYLSEIFSFYTEDFLQQASSLIDYVNRYRERLIPTHYRVKFIPYDWRLNKQP